MSAISGQSAPPFATPRPLADRLADRLAERLSAAIGGEVSAGTLTADDGAALASAVAAIDSRLSTEREADRPEAGAGPRLDPSRARERIDALIADQVSAGTLTGAQADALRGLFARSQGTPSGETAKPSGSPAADAAEAAASDVLATFIQRLQASQQAGGYAGGTGTRPSALLFDFES